MSAPKFPNKHNRKEVSLDMTEMPIGDEPTYKYSEFMRYPLPNVPAPTDVTIVAGRYKLPSPTTGRITSYSRATSVGKALSDETALIKWWVREKVAAVLRAQGYAANLHDGLTDNEMAMSVAYNDLIRTMANPEKVSDVNTIIDFIHDLGGGKDAAELGSAIHDWLAELDTGRVLFHQLPDYIKPYATSYQRVLREAGLVPVAEYTERVVMNDRGSQPIAGRIDRIYRRVDTGDLVLGDLKSSKSLDLSLVSFSVQLGIYGYATLMLSTDGATWEEMPKIDQEQAVLIHLPSDKPEMAKVVPFDLWVAGEALVKALEVKEQRKLIPKTVLAVTSPTPSESAVRYVEARHALLNIKAVEDASAVFEQYEDVWNDDLTELGTTCIELLATNEQEN